MLGLALANGCSGDDDVAVSDAGGVPDSGGAEDAATVEPHVVLGTGESSFQPLTDGGTIELVSGPQGGFHVLVSALLYGMDPEGLLLTYEVRRVGETAQLNMPTQIALRTARVIRDGDHWVRTGDFAVLAISAPADVIGDTVEIVVRAEPVAGGTFEDTRTVTVVDERMEL